MLLAQANYKCMEVSLSIRKLRGRKARKELLDWRVLFKRVVCMMFGLKSFSAADLKFERFVDLSSKAILPTVTASDQYGRHKTNGDPKPVATIDKKD